MTDIVHLDSLSVVLRVTLIQLALMDSTKLMGVCNKVTDVHMHTQCFIQEDPNMYVRPSDALYPSGVYMH